MPNIGVSSSGDAAGTTQSAIAGGALIIRDTANQTQDVNDLSRDTEHANGSIGKIFDKQKVEEQQELAAVFGQMANQYAGDIGVSMGWGADSKEKAAVHGVIGAIQASLGGGSALAGGLAGLGSEAFGQLVHNYLTENTTLDAKEKAAITQWAAAVSGAAVGGVVAGSTGASSGAAAALDAERYNRQLHPDERAEIKKLADGDEEKEQRLLAEACRRVECASEFALNSQERAYYESLMQNQAATPEERQALDNYWVTQFKESYGNYPSYAGTEDKHLFQYGEGDKLNDSQQFVRNQYVVELSDKLGVEVETARRITEGMSLATLVVAAKNGKDLPGKAKDTGIWTATKKADPVANAYGHWDKHKKEFPEYQNAKQYVDATHNFVSNPPPGTMIKTRPNGETVYYNPTTNTFAVKRTDGVPRTMFKPDPADHGYKTNLDYFNAQ
ncbi:MAG: hypothetical protein WCD24_05305 [Serratia inhibens]|uniref:hypothetical protein n=1 Tax=Serratia inhibens TaxID=2338073 RepID=UPI003C7CFE33